MQRRTSQSSGLSRQRGTRLWVAAGVISVALLSSSFGDTPARAQSNGGLASSVTVQGSVNAIANHGGNAANVIGSSSGDGSGSSRTYVGGSVTTLGQGRSSAKTTIGDASKSGTTIVKGGAVNMGGEINVGSGGTVTGTVRTMEGSSARVGGCGSATVLGDVTVLSGSVEVGCGCVARRNGACCIEVYQTTCVLSKVPPNKSGCPPGYAYSGDGMCRLYSGLGEHSIGSGSMY